MGGYLKPSIFAASTYKNLIVPLKATIFEK
jgi:hypothetical protein